MTLDLKQIYNLLPSVYRIRDAEIALQSGNSLDPADLATLQSLQSLLSTTGTLSFLDQQTLNELTDKQQRGPLKSLIAIIAEQIEVLQESLYQGYDDLFIETCQSWAVPYIAELVGLRGLIDIPNTTYTVRAAVADTIKNRRRKGTISVLESVAHDTTQWPANAVEFFLLLSTTQFMNHIRPGNLSMADIRNADNRLLQTPFDTYARTAEMRKVETGLGKYNIPNIGIFLWRLEQQQMNASPAMRVDERRYCFDPIGRSVPLFTFPIPQDATTPRVTPINVPMPISRRMLADPNGAKNYYGRGKSIYVDAPIPGVSQQPPICSCDLSDVKGPQGNVIAWGHQPANCIGIDPQLGRIAFPSNLAAPLSVHTTYCYGFSKEMGGGPYSRVFNNPFDIFIQVPGQAATVQAALTQASSQLVRPKTRAVIEVTNNEYYFETPSVTIPAGTSIQLRAKDENRPVLVLSDDLVVRGGNDSSFEINGFLVAGGGLSVPASGAADDPTVQIDVTHCTFSPISTPSIGSPPAGPLAPSLLIESSNVTVNVSRSILGVIRVSVESAVALADSIVDALSAEDVAYANPSDAASAAAPMKVTNCTIIGKIHTQRMDLASNSIFYAALGNLDDWAAPVIAEQLQQGCVRFCYVPPGSQLPSCYHCYPTAASPSAPSFTSLRFGDPGYCQLRKSSGTQILQGADNESEIGAFNGLCQPQRLSNLNTMLSDFLRFGLEAGVFFAT
jgi:hypothetical protein